MRRNNKGVSLIVLSITILVMAILAATAIIALEDSGIIGRSKNTTAKQNYTEEYTRLQVIKNGILTDNLGEITVDEYITELTNKGIIESGTTTNSDGSKTVTTKTGFVLNVKQDGESNLILSLGESNSAISISPVTLTGDITDGPITKTITATTKNVSGDISWTTSNSSVATVTGTNSGATVTLKGVGTATITATYGAAKASCTVVVTEGSTSTSTATITSATITPSSSFVFPSAAINVAATLNKGNISETLNFRVVIDEYAFNSNRTAITKTGEQEVYTFSSSNENITYTYNANSRTSTSHFFIVNLEVLDSSNNILDTYAFKHSTEYSTNFDYSYRTACMPAGTLILVEEEYEDENGNKKKRRKKKRIEDLTYDDDLVVWDFDNGCFTTAKPIWLMKKQYADEYNELTFSNGAVLKTVREHRIFNKELGKFTYPMGEETRLGTTTFTEDGEEVTLVNRRVVDEKVEYYNVITNYHINAFAEGILTSCRLSNLYDIKEMKYVKDDRELVDIKEFKDISEEYYHGLRLGEQRKNVNNEGDFSDLNSWTEYVNRLIGWAKKK